MLLKINLKIIKTIILHYQNHTLKYKSSTIWFNINVKNYIERMMIVTQTRIILTIEWSMRKKKTTKDTTELMSKSDRYINIVDKINNVEIAKSYTVTYLRCNTIKCQQTHAFIYYNLSCSCFLCVRFLSVYLFFLTFKPYRLYYQLQCESFI